MAIDRRNLGRLAAWGAGAAAAAQFAPSVVVLGQWTPLRSLPGPLCRWRGPTEGGVALTFDDGPHPVATPAVLDRLDDLGLRATFFMVGSLAEQRPDLVAEVARRGHQVETHGYRHEHHLWRTPRWVLADLQAALGAMERCGVHPRWYRPSFGQAAGSTLAAAAALGLRTVLWSSWGREWATTDAAAVAARIGRRLGPGSIVLLHDSDDFGPPGMWRVGLRSLDAVAERIRSAGLQAVTLDEMVPVEPPARTPADTAGRPVGGPPPGSVLQLVGEAAP